MCSEINIFIKVNKYLQPLSFNLLTFAFQIYDMCRLDILLKPLIFIIAVGMVACKGTKETAHEEVKVDEAISSTNSLLWQVTGNGLKEPSYLFGTMHIIKNENYFFGKNAEKKVKSAKTVVFEVDMDNMNMMAVTKGALMPEGKTLKDYCSEEDYQLIEDFFHDSLDIAPAMFKMAYAKMKPMFIEQMIIVAYLGENPESYETNIAKIAEAKNKPIEGLETLEQQMSFLENLPLEDQVETLIETVKDYGGTKTKFDEMVEAYLAQNIEKLQESVESADVESGFYTEELLAKRNTAWIPKLKSYFESGSTFVAVGAGHLGGEIGVIQLLKKEGYTVVPISMD